MKEFQEYKGYARAKHGGLIGVKLNTTVVIHHFIDNRKDQLKELCEQNNAYYPVLAVVNGGKQ